VCGCDGGTFLVVGGNSSNWNRTCTELFFLYFRTSSNVTVIAGVRSRKFKIETLRGIDM
jgi:hypothetical protein